jgi:hypothetical protein
MKRVWTFVLVVLVTSAGLHAQASNSNGIAVGRAKLFDDRSLVLMLEQLRQSLNAVQSIDTKGLFSSVGQLQGSQENEVMRSLEIVATPSPVAAAGGTSLTTSQPKAPPNSGSGDTGSNDTSGNGSSSSSKTQSKSGSDSGSNGDSSNSSNSGGNSDTSKKFGISAQDLLSEQVNLTYEIYNLRLLLERAQTDRLYGNQPRLQAVLGFEISLDPPKRFQNSAAVVEVTVTPKDGSESPSLVALMPREKTYNAATLDKRSNAFTGAVLAKIIQVGFTEKHSGTTYFLYKDSDTFAFDRQQRPVEGKGTPQGITFGWQFRPVFDRASVAPGLRQVFAVIAMPSGVTEKPNVEIRVRSYWTRFYAGKAEVTSASEEKRSSDSDCYNFPVFSSDGANEDLAAKVESATWHAVGSEGVLIDVSGFNFYSGTTALFGNSVLSSPATGLLLKSDQRLQILTTSKALAASDGVINGRYGLPSPIRDNRGGQPVCKAGCGAEIAHVHFKLDPERSNGSVDIDVTTPCVAGRGQDLHSPDFSGKKPLVAIGDYIVTEGILQQPITLTVDELNKQCEPVIPRKTRNTDGIRLTIQSPKTLLTKEQPVVFKIPFLGPQYRSEAFLYPGLRVDKIVRVSDGDPIFLDILGADFNDNVEVLADQNYKVDNTNLKRFGSTVLRLQAPKTRMSSVKELIVYREGEEPIVATVGPNAPGPPKPSFASKEVKATAGAIQSVVFSGEGLTAVSSVQFDGAKLPSEISANGTKLTVHLSSKVTQHSGESVEILAMSAAGEIIETLLVDVVPKEVTNVKAAGAGKQTKSQTQPSNAGGSGKKATGGSQQPNAKP